MRPPVDQPCQHESAGPCGVSLVSLMPHRRPPTARLARSRLRGRRSATDQQPPCDHPNSRPAAAHCTRCGRPICSDCAHLQRLEQLCPQCAHRPGRNPDRFIRDLLRGQWPLTVGLLAVNIALLLIAGVRSRADGPFLAGSVLEPGGYQLCKLGGLSAAAIAQHRQYCRLLTSAGLHLNVLHLAYNSLALLYFGPALEDALGPLRFLALYVGAGIAGSAASYTIDHPLLGLGASGAIYGVGGALLEFFWRRRAVTGSVWTLTATILLLSLGLGVLTPHVGATAHLGGLLTGLVAMTLLDAGFQQRRRWLSVAALGVPLLLTAGLVVIGTATFAQTSAFSPCPMAPTS